jgi:hypothetical protein
MKKFITSAVVGVALIGVGCNEETSPSPQATNPAAPASQAPAAAAPHAGAPHNRMPLGETTMGGLKLVATQDAPAKPGGEGAFDVVITGGKPKAVRFWVGTEDAKGSVKAKADEETPDNWHTHAELPDPLPAGSKFWVEVEPPTGETFKVSFDFKQQ